MPGAGDVLTPMGGSEIQFAMHPDDEAAFAAQLLAEDHVVFVDGPRWPAASARTTRRLDDVGAYCIVWSPHDLDPLAASYIPTCDDWYCNSEHATIQFLRSELRGGTLTSGRIAIHGGLADLDADAQAAITKRYNRLRRWIRKHFRNRALVAPEHPDYVFDGIWLGPHAAAWLQRDARHRVHLPTPAVLAPSVPE